MPATSLETAGAGLEPNHHWKWFREYGQANCPQKDQQWHKDSPELCKPCDYARQVALKYVAAQAGETAGEMTAEQFYDKIWQHEVIKLPRPDRRSPEWIYLFAEAFAKQRVEQAVDAAELRCEKLYNHEQECRIEGLRAKVADLERERDTALNRHVQFMVQGGPVVMSADFDKMKTRAEAAESELREMREALELAQKWLANCLPIGNIPGPKPLPVIARVLARKAGSSD